MTSHIERDVYEGFDNEWQPVVLHKPSYVKTHSIVRDEITPTDQNLICLYNFLFKSVFLSQCILKSYFPSTPYKDLYL